MTVADMNRLEQAARVSMGGFQYPEASASPRSSHPSLRSTVITLAALVLLIAVLHPG